MSPQYLGYRLAQWASVRVPPRQALRCADRLADLWWRGARRDRAAVAANLSLILGRAVAVEEAQTRETFRHFARYLVEFFTSHREPPPMVRVEGEPHLRAATGGGRGAIILTAHLGNWEVGAAVLQRMGFPMSVVALPHGDAAMDRLFNRQRARCGLDVIPVGPRAVRLSLMRLRAGSLLGLLGDREFGANGMRLPLPNGAMVTVPRGPAILSLRSGAPALPSFLLREEPWAFRLCLEPPIWPEGHGDEAIRALTARYLEVIGRHVQRAPSQWLMFQPATSS